MSRKQEAAAKKIKRKTSHEKEKRERVGKSKQEKEEKYLAKRNACDLWSEITTRFMRFYENEHSAPMPSPLSPPRNQHPTCVLRQKHCKNAVYFVLDVVN